MSGRSPGELGEHRVHGRVVMPAAGHVAMVLFAVREIQGEGAYELEDVTFREALGLGEEGWSRVQVVLNGETFRVSSAETVAGEVSWKLHADGKVRKGVEEADRVRLPEGEGSSAGPLREAMAAAGYELGPGFQWIERIWSSGEEAWGRMRVAGEEEVAERAAVHPGLLDACLQVVGAAVMGRGEEVRAYMPIHVERMRWRGGGWERLWSRAVLRNVGRETLKADVQIVDETGRMVGTLEGLSVKRARSEALNPSHWRNWLYQVEWRLQSRKPEQARLSHPARIARRLREQVEQATPEILDQAGLLWPELERLSVGYATRAVERLGRDSRTVAPEHRKLWDRVLEINRDATDGSPSDAESLKLAYPAFGAELGLLANCGEHLAEVLEGKMQPVQLLFAEPPHPNAARLYEESPVARALNERLREATRASVEKLRPDTRLRVLEIGAGTGASTGYVLDALKGFQTEYVFSDISPIFLSRAAHRFGERVVCTRLDIERNPDEQGFAGRRFHLIVAAQVLHATRDLKESLRHIRQLLEPDGVVLLSEGTEALKWADLTFGMMPGWWRFADTERRPRHALLNRTAWESLLTETGFHGGTALAAAQTGPLAQQAIIVAGRDSGKGRWLILADCGGVGAQLADRLRSEGEEAEIVSRAEEALERALESRCRAVVHLWSLDAEQQAWRGVLDLVQRLARSPTSAGTPALFIVTRGAQTVSVSRVGSREIGEAGLDQAITWGLANVIALEHPELACTGIDLDPAGGAEGLFEEILSGGADRVALREGLRYVPVLAQVKTADESERLHLAIGARGMIEQLKWIAQPARELRDDEVEIDVRATGLNFLDVMDALGQLPFQRDWFGAECSGVVAAAGRNTEWKPGDSVVAIAPGAFTTRLQVDARFVAAKPEHLSFAETAAIPVAFLSAICALQEAADIKAGDRVLIHAAAGGVGLAAVQLALRAGAEVFATAGTAEKRAYLESIGVRRPMDSRSLEFAEQIMRRTGGAGVNIAINSLAGEFIPKSLIVMARNGAFLELGKTRIWTSEEVRRYRPDIRYSVIALNELIVNKPDQTAAAFQALIERFRQRALQPLPVESFPAEQTVDAFRRMQRSQHIGKIVVVRPGTLPAAAVPVTLSSDRTYLIAGGWGGLGLLLAEWLVERGARHLVLVGRGEPSEAAQRVFAELRQRGAHVVTPRADISRREELARVLADCRESMPPLGGVVNAAGVLDEGVIVHQTWQRIQAVLDPKVTGTWNLHILTPNEPLDFFVMFSSLAALLGPPGQAGHAAANAFLDAFAHFRRASGLPALSINWGAWSSTGAAARKGFGREAARPGKEAANGTIRLIHPREGLEAFGCLFKSGATQIAVSPMDRDAIGRALPGIAAAPLISEMRGGGSVESLRNEAAEPLRVAARPVNVADDEMLMSHLSREVTELLGLAPSVVIEPGRPLHEFGLDSLMALELRNRLAANFGRPLPATLLFDHPTLEALTGYLSREVFGRKPASSGRVLPVRTAVNDPIAVIGIGCRFPGAGTGPMAFRDSLMGRRNAVTEVPASRWDIDAWYDSDPGKQNRMNSRFGAFLEEVDLFDSGFFGISPREAAVMDPQQRLLLETTWHALEDAGQLPQQLSGSQAGVFIGMSTQDYVDLLNQAGSMDNFRATGNSASVSAGRISYFLGLQGPSMAVDTACSSSLVAVHLACQSLRAGECGLALAGGVNLVLSPTSMLALSALRMLAPDGRCKTFDARADGFVRGEGCGVVVLKRLSEAEQAGDRILGVILGSAVNQDGRSSGLTAPNGPAQESVIRRALEMAQVEPWEVQYVEAHGTGTKLGDPIEVQALNGVLGEGRKKEKALRIGSVKTNIGHLEAAAGIAGLIKVVLALGEEKIPPQLHFVEPNPHIEWERMAVEVVTEATPWHEGRRAAGVSSFGFGGTNAHVVLERAPEGEKRERQEGEAGEGVLSEGVLGEAVISEGVLRISARTPEALRELTGRYAAYLETTAEGWLDICSTAENGRARFEHQLAVRASSVAEGRRKLLNGEIEAAGTDNAGSRGAGAESAVGVGRRKKVALPLYPFQRQRYWIPEGKRGKGTWLGARIPTAGREAVFEGRLSGRSPGELGEHRVHGRVVMPAAGHVAMVLFAAGEIQGQGAYELEDVTFREALGLGEEGWSRVQVVLNGETFRVSSAETVAGEVSWKLHAEGKVRKGVGEADRVRLPEGEGSSAGPLREAMAAAGYELGPGFQWIERIWSSGEEAWGRMRAAGEEEVAERAAVHPGLLDACLQVVGAAVMGRGEDVRAYMPIHVERMRWRGGGWERLWSRAVLRNVGRETLKADVQILDEAGRMVGTLEGLSVKRARSEALNPSHWRNWLYQVEWRLQSRQPNRTPAVEGRWLILADRSGAGRELAERLRSQGAEVAVVPRAEGSLRAAMQSSWRGVVHLWSLDETADYRCRSVLELVQELARTRGADKLGLWIVTRGAQPINPAEFTDAGVEQAAVWGFANVIAREHPELACRRIDLDPADGSFGLFEEILSPSEEDQVALRADLRYVPRLVPRLVPATIETAFEARADGTYLITGAFGGIGLVLARWLVDRGARHLVLAGRRAPSDSASQLLESLAAGGLDVKIVCADVSREADMISMFAQIPSAFPLRGIFHAAGVLEDGVIIQQQWDRFAKVLAPKIDGAWHLQRLSREMTLDFFVLFSSAACLLGSPGQSSHAAANAFLDAMAHRLRGLGIPAVSIDWGAWAETGAAAQRGATDSFAGQGVAAMPSSQALRALEHILTSNVVQTAVLPIDWRVFSDRVLEVASPFLSELMRESPSSAPLADLALQIRTVPPEDRGPFLTAHIEQQVRTVLRLEPNTRINPRVPISEFGLDSLLALELSRSLGASLGTRLPATLVFDYPTVESLTEFLAVQIFGVEEPAEILAAQPSPPGTEEAETVDDNEIHRLLLRELARSGY